MTGEREAENPCGMGPWKKGDRVVVKPEHRHRFNGPAGRGEVLTVTGRNGAAVGIGPKPSDYAYHGELEVPHG